MKIKEIVIKLLTDQDTSFKVNAIFFMSENYSVEKLQSEEYVRIFVLQQEISNANEDSRNWKYVEWELNKYAIAEAKDSSHHQQEKNVNMLPPGVIFSLKKVSTMDL